MKIRISSIDDDVSSEKVAGEFVRQKNITVGS